MVLCCWAKFVVISICLVALFSLFWKAVSSYFYVYTQIMSQAIIKSYDPEWQSLFHKECEAILHTFVSFDITVEHIST